VGHRWILAGNDCDTSNVWYGVGVRYVGTGTIFNQVEPEPFYKQANWNHFQALGTRTIFNGEEEEPFSM
jgi:hypothetical protein